MNLSWGELKLISILVLEAATKGTLCCINLHHDMCLRVSSVFFRISELGNDWEGWQDKEEPRIAVFEFLKTLKRLHPFNVFKNSKTAMRGSSVSCQPSQAASSDSRRQFECDCLEILWVKTIFVRFLHADFGQKMLFGKFVINRVLNRTSNNKKFDC